VGDKTTIALVPMVASCGVPVAKMSGRGLGHTGGTLDKLEAIPGFSVRISMTEFRKVLREAGFGLTGQTPEIAPADRRLYALRDVTATVESLPLIAASIMSKKMAEGSDTLVLDVKTGDGAFLRSIEQATELAESMISIGRGMGRKVVALVTDMDQPLGCTIGNALEVVECIEALKGRGPHDLESLSVELAAWMVYLSELAPSLDAARTKVRDALHSGAGLEKLRKVIELQGGDPRVCDDVSLLPRARGTERLTAPFDGRVVGIACRATGRAAMLLGAGRETAEGDIDPAVGIVLHRKVGDKVIEGEPILTVHYNDARRLDDVMRTLREAVRIAPEAPMRAPLIRAVLGR
jgi:pyrimidine-nucleoside phosphorylase